MSIWRNMSAESISYRMRGETLHAAAGDSFWIEDAFDDHFADLAKQGLPITDKVMVSWFNSSKEDLSIRIGGFTFCANAKDYVELPEGSETIILQRKLPLVYSPGGLKLDCCDVKPIASGEVMLVPKEGYHIDDEMINKPKVARKKRGK